MHGMHGADTPDLRQVVQVGVVGGNKEYSHLDYEI